MERKLGDVGTFHNQTESSGGPHGGAHGGENRKSVPKFIGVLEIFLPEWICMTKWLPRLNPIPAA